mmetsp:Transcript_19807/g.52661  ORF Transcript_19807/g.52661 Transcript_19807/m.52661 type:complete len:212 (-) Transcript_19807:11-646(-)
MYCYVTEKTIVSGSHGLDRIRALVLMLDESDAPFPDMALAILPFVCPMLKRLEVCADEKVSLLGLNGANYFPHLEYLSLWTVKEAMSKDDILRTLEGGDNLRELRISGSSYCCNPEVLHAVPDSVKILALTFLAYFEDAAEFQESLPILSSHPNIQELTLRSVCDPDSLSVGNMDWLGLKPALSRLTSIAIESLNCKGTFIVPKFCHSERT